MSTIIDRRGQSRNGQISSRRRFLDRNRRHVRKAMDKAISERKIGDIGQDGVDVTIPQDGVNEPTIGHGQGGRGGRVFPGNKELEPGDKIPKPKGGKGKGNQASPDGEGEDEFTFHLTREEFLEFLFEDLELPNLTKIGDQDTTQTKNVPAGYATDGPPNRRDLPKSVARREARRIAGGQKYKKEILALKEEQRDIFEKYIANDDTKAQQLSDKKATKRGGDSQFIPIKTKLKQIDSELDILRTDLGGKLSAQDAERIDEIDKQIEGLQTKVGAIPVWDEKNDMQYRINKKEPVPTSKAVMFCLMDVSFSMDEETKMHAKLFFELLHQFLQRHYEKTEIVFIRHHSKADEVDHDTFFYDRTSGGTVVSTAHEKMLEVMEERYPPGEWNIYGAQASDGDNHPKDNVNVEDYLQKIMPKVQAFFYTELLNEFSRRLGRTSAQDGLWDTIEKVSGDFPSKLFLGLIKDKPDIWPVFHEFFKKRESYDIEDRRVSAFEDPSFG